LHSFETSGKIDFPFFFSQENNMGAYYLYDKTYLMHYAGSGHPESPGRLIAVKNAVEGAEWYDQLIHLSSRVQPVSLEVLSLVHHPSYIETVQKECESGHHYLSTGDTAICEDSYRVALHAVGGVLAAVDAVFENFPTNTDTSFPDTHGAETTGAEILGGLPRPTTAFCAVRPPGHHASADRGMGFCIFNNIAVAARYAQMKYHLERIMIVDWDVHHGNGTQDIFYDDDSILFTSIHQFPHFPGSGAKDETGIGKGKGFTINCPLPPGTGNKKIIDTFVDELIPAAEKFKPQLVLLSAGFDGRLNDPMAHFRLDNTGFRLLTRITREIANTYSNGRIVSVLEGGYSFAGLAASVLTHLKELL
jgi:acetoin utilization deacetylase AcuC-like enzyme